MFLCAVVTKYSDRPTPFNFKYTAKDSVSVGAPEAEVAEGIDFNKCAAGRSNVVKRRLNQ